MHDCIIQWKHLPEEDYTIDPNFVVQKLEVGRSTWNDLDKELAEISSDSASEAGSSAESFDGLDDAIDAEMDELRATIDEESTKRKFDEI